MDRCVVLGDSNFVRLCKLRAFKNGVPIPLINLSRSGAKVVDGLNLLKSYLSVSHYESGSQTIVILLGTNDLSHNNLLDRNNFLRITRIARNCFKQVLICKIPPSPKLDRQLISISNQWLYNFKSVENISIVDLFSPFNDAHFHKFYPSGTPDNIHFNNRGLRLVSSILVSSLSEINV